MHIEINVMVENEAELEQLINIVARRFGDPAVFSSLHGLVPPHDVFEEAQTSAPTAPTTAPDAEPKRKRGRPRKDTPGVVDIVPEGSDLGLGSEALAALNDVLDLPSDLPPDVVQRANGGDGATKAAPPPTDADPEPSFVFDTNMTPEQQRVTGRNMLLDLVQKAPAKGGAVNKLIKKYGVKSFLEVPDARSREFLADAMMIANSNEA